MFDCVLPTRNARNGQLFTFDGKMNIRNTKYKSDFSPIDGNGISPMSETYTKAYLHHLFKTEEILGYRIATQHNLRFYIHLMKTMQNEIQKGNFESWSKEFIMQYSLEVTSN
jgi:queuine tRNA-ribosyltransferase